MTDFEQALSAGPIVMVQLTLPATGADEALPALADRLKTQVDAFLVGDNPWADPRVSPLAAGRLLAERGLTTVVTLTCRDRNRLALASDLLGARALGLNNILAVTGVHPRLGPCPGARPVYDLDSVQLLKIIHDMNQGRLPDGRSLETPTHFFAGAAVNPEASPPAPGRMKFRLKVSAGAGFLISQAVFHPEKFINLAEEAGSLGVGLLAGLLVFGPDEVRAVAEGRRPGWHVPPEWLADLRADPDRIVEKSVSRARETAAALKGRAAGFLVMAPGLEEQLPGLLPEMDLG